MALVLGLLAPFRGAVFIARHGLWGYLAMPVIANILVALGAAFFAFWLTGRWLPAADAGWAEAGRAVLALVLTIPTFLVTYPLVSSAFIDLLTEKTERIVRGGHPEVAFGTAALQAVAHGLAKSLLYLLAIGSAALLSLLTGVGTVMGLLLAALFLAFDSFDYPLARRKVGFGGKWQYLARHPALTLGFATSTSAFFLVPFAFVAAPPLAAVGATLAFLDTEDPLETAHAPTRREPLQA